MSPLPLKRVRIVDLSWGIAGPSATSILATVGAEVIRIESAARPDIQRMGDRERTHFGTLNLNKRGISLDLKKPAAVDIVKRLVSMSQAVVENFRPGVMGKLGLGYEDLRKIKPDILMVSQSAFGDTGSDRDLGGFAPIFSAMGGLAHVTGYGDGVPTELRESLDFTAGQAIAFALLAGLMWQRKTGKGQYVDISARDVVVSQLGEILLDYVLNGRDRGSQGNRDDFMSPHNSYRCKGEDKWTTIVVGTDEEWQNLCKALDRPAWTADHRFSGTLGRLRYRDEMDKLIESWTIDHTDYEVMNILQEAGVAAAPSFSADQLFTDPHLKRRGQIIKVRHPTEGQVLTGGMPWILSNTKIHIDRYGHSLGQDNDYVFGKILGMSSEDIQHLVKEEVIR